MLLKIITILADFLFGLFRQTPKKPPQLPQDGGDSVYSPTHSDVRVLSTSEKSIEILAQKEQKEQDGGKEGEAETVEQKPEQKPQIIPAFIVEKYMTTEDSTLSKMYHRGKFLCYILEDGIREKKVKGRTAIWAGVYKIVRRTHGGFYNQYKTEFGHKYSIELSGVRGFSDILTHIGNTIINTLGCLLTGTGWTKGRTGNYEVTKSTEAYLKFYDAVEKEFEEHGEAYIEVRR